MSERNTLFEIIDACGGMSIKELKNDLGTNEGFEDTDLERWNATGAVDENWKNTLAACIGISVDVFDELKDDSTGIDTETLKEYETLTERKNPKIVHLRADNTILVNIADEDEGSLIASENVATNVDKDIQYVIETNKQKIDNDDAIIDFLEEDEKAEREAIENEEVEEEATKEDIFEEEKKAEDIDDIRKSMMSLAKEFDVDIEIDKGNNVKLPINNDAEENTDINTDKKKSDVIPMNIKKDKVMQEIDTETKEDIIEKEINEILKDDIKEVDEVLERSKREEIIESYMKEIDFEKIAFWGHSIGQIFKNNDTQKLSIIRRVSNLDKKAKFATCVKQMVLQKVDGEKSIAVLDKLISQEDQTIMHVGIFVGSLISQKKLYASICRVIYEVSGVTEETLLSDKEALGNKLIESSVIKNIKWLRSLLTMDTNDSESERKEKKSVESKKNTVESNMNAKGI